MTDMSFLTHPVLLVKVRQPMLANTALSLIPNGAVVVGCNVEEFVTECELEYFYVIRISGVRTSKKEFSVG